MTWKAVGGGGGSSSSGIGSRMFPRANVCVRCIVALLRVQHKSICNNVTQMRLRQHVCQRQQLPHLQNARQSLLSRHHLQPSCTGGASGVKSGRPAPQTQGIQLLLLAGCVAFSTFSASLQGPVSQHLFRQRTHQFLRRVFSFSVHLLVVRSYPRAAATRPRCNPPPAINPIS